MSSLRRTFAVTVSLAVPALAASVLVTTPAAADPQQYHPATAVSASDIVGVGSDTTQYLVNDLADGTYADVLRTKKATPFTAGFNTAERRMVSFDAVNPVDGKDNDTITVRPGVTMERPSGSSAGIKALMAAGPLAGTTHDTIDFARSSRGPKDAEKHLAFLTTAVDAVTWARHSGNGVSTLTTGQLKSIFECSTTNWSQVGGSDAVITVIVPPAGSGTRSFFLKSIDVKDEERACWITAQENDPAPIADIATSIAPFSVARYLAPKGADVSKLSLGSVGGAAPIVDGTLNGSFPMSRSVYTVVKRVDGEVPARLATVFGNGTTGEGSFLCSAQGAAIVKSNGFGVSPKCGQAVK